MNDPLRSPGNGDDSVVGPDRGSTTGAPRWVKVLGIIVVVLVLGFLVGLLTGGHGPGRHTPSGLTSDRTAPSSLMDVSAPLRSGDG